MNNLQIFKNEEFGEIRTVEQGGKIWFVGKDVAEALKYSNTNDAIIRHVDSYDRANIVIHDGRQERTMIGINESGLYALIFGSKLESAKTFKYWVTSEVLPSIRKTGAYQKPMSPMQLMELQFEAIKEVDSKVNEVNQDLQAFKMDMPILGIECDRITTAVRRKGVKCLGGKDSEAYQDKSLRGRVYSDIYGQLKREFGVSSYKAIKRNQTDTAVRIVNLYELPMALEDEIADVSAQMVLN